VQVGTVQPAYGVSTAVQAGTVQPVYGVSTAVHSSSQPAYGVSTAVHAAGVQPVYGVARSAPQAGTVQPAYGVSTAVQVCAAQPAYGVSTALQVGTVQPAYGVSTAVQFCAAQPDGVSTPVQSACADACRSRLSAATKQVALIARTFLALCATEGALAGRWRLPAAALAHGGRTREAAAARISRAARRSIGSRNPGILPPVPPPAAPRHVRSWS
jgi:hypothetical protein